jgi:hypothetical protein
LRASTIRALHAALSFACLLSLATRASAEDVTMRVRIEWGGGTERSVLGTVEINRGRLSDPKPLGIEADESGTICDTGDGRIRIASRSKRLYDGFDVTVTAPLDALLFVYDDWDLDKQEARIDGVPQLSGGPRKEVATIPLSQLIDEFYNGEIDKKGNRLLVRRAPGDKFRVTLARDSLVFSPGEMFELEMQPHLLSAPPGTRLRLQSKLVAARGGRVGWTDDREIVVPEAGQAFAAIPLAIKLPDQEGVYDLLFQATRRSLQDRLGLPDRLGLRPAAIEERRVQLVVVAKDRPPMPTNSAPFELLVEIDPANPGWWDRVKELPANIPLMSSWHKGPLGNGGLAPWQHSLGTLVQLAAAPREADTPWEAYPLPVSKPNQPHIVEVEYPSNVPQTLGISIIDPNAAGAVMPIGLDSGVYLPSEAAEAPAKLEKHRLIFWPRTNSPLLLMTNRKPGARAVYGKIRLLGPKAASLTSSLPMVGRELGESRLSRAFPPEARTADRLLAAYYDRPLFPENFSANQSVDAWSSHSGKALDDWTTFYEGGSRLVEYLNHVGYNGLMLTVLADGSTIYPSSAIEPTPRYDDGIFFASGQDPVRKDALELLLRLFDREQMKLIPTVQFSSPLAELEAIRRSGGAEAIGIDLVAADGTRWLDRHNPRKGLAPYYNPLSPRVQDAMLAVVRELLDRYREHPSFAGIGVQLSADGYAQLPGIEWGCDEETLARFQRETKVDLGPSDPQSLKQRAALLTGKHRSAWLAWRAQQLHRFYQRLENEVCQARRGTKLYLAGADLFNRPEIEHELRPALPKTANIDEVLLELGIDPSLYQKNASTVLLRPNRLAPLHSLSAQAVTLELNQAPDLDRSLHSHAHPATLFYHEPQEIRLTSFDAKSPFKKTYTRLVAQPSPAGQLNRRRFIHALATLDTQEMFDGGWLLPIGQEDELREFITTYRQLPAAAFETLQGQTQPVTIRTWSDGQQTYVYLVNNSPWKATATVDVQAPAGTKLTALGNTARALTLKGDGAGRTCTVELGPYDLVAGVLSGKAKIYNSRVQVQGAVGDALATRIKDLWSRAAALKNPAPLEILENADFEAAAADGLPPGWRAGPQTKIDTTQPHQGVQSLKVVGESGGSQLLSKPFPAPTTGRISVSVWLRVADEARQPALRLGIDGQLGGQEYYRFATVGQAPGSQRIRSVWGQYVFQIQDLPATGMSPLRVRFDLAGGDEVWIDDVRIYDLDFTDNERLELSKTITLADFKQQNGELADCVRVLEGYWPRFLLSNVPLVQQPLASKPAAPIIPPPPATEDKKPGLLDRFRRSLPDFMR